MSHFITLVFTKENGRTVEEFQKKITNILMEKQL